MSNDIATKQIKSGNKFGYGKATTYGFQEVNFSSLRELGFYALHYAVAPAIYKGGHRHSKNLMSIGNCVIIDIDKISQRDMENLLHNIRISQLNFAAIPSQNCNKNDIRFKLVIPITNLTKENYKLVWIALTKQFGIIGDEATKDLTRFFAPTIPAADKYPKYNQTVVKNITEVFGYEGYLYNDTGYVLDVANLRLQEIKEAEALETVTLKDAIPFISAETPIKVSLYEGKNKKIDRLVDKTITLGELADVLKAGLAEDKVNVYCLYQNEHTDPENKKYAWVQYTPTIGAVMYHCGGTTCKEKHRNSYIVDCFDHTKVIGANKYMPITLSKLMKGLERALLEYYVGENQLWDIINKNAIALMLMVTGAEKGDYHMTHISHTGEWLEAVKVRAKDTYKLYSFWRGVLFDTRIYNFIKAYNATVDENRKVSDISLFVTIVEHININLSNATYTYQEDVDIFADKTKLVCEKKEFASSLTVIRPSFDIQISEKPLILNSVGEELEDPDNAHFNYIIETFNKHWGSIPFDILNFALANSVTKNYRPKGMIIEAASGSGKSTLIEIFANLGLTNTSSPLLTEFLSSNRSAINHHALMGKLFISFDEIDASALKSGFTSKLKDTFSGKYFTIAPKGIAEVTLSTEAFILFGAEAESFYVNLDEQSKSRFVLYPSRDMKSFSSLGLQNTYSLETVKEVITYYIGIYFNNLIKFIKTGDRKEVVRWANNLQQYYNRVTEQDNTPELIKRSIDEDIAAMEDYMPEYKRGIDTSRPSVQALYALNLADVLIPINFKSLDKDEGFIPFMREKVNISDDMVNRLKKFKGGKDNKGVSPDWWRLIKTPEINKERGYRYNGTTKSKLPYYMYVACDPKELQAKLKASNLGRINYWLYVELFKIASRLEALYV